MKRRPAWDPTWGETPSVALTDGFHLNETLPLLASCREAGTKLFSMEEAGSREPRSWRRCSPRPSAVSDFRFRAGRPMRTRPSPGLRNGACRMSRSRAGPKPILGWDRGRRFEIEIAQIDAVDTLGAGDVLHGAFCFHFARDRQFEPALRLAAEIATSCRRVWEFGSWNRVASTPVWYADLP